MTSLPAIVNRSVTARPSLARNVTVAAAGSVLYAGCQWGILLVIAKVSGATDVGTFTLALTIAGPVFVLSNLQLRSFQATDARHEFSLTDYIGLRMTTTLVAAVLTIALGALLGNRGEVLTIIAAVAASKSVESILDILYGHFQKNERMDRVCMSLCFRGGLSLVAVFLILAATGNLVLACWSISASWLVVLFAWDLPFILKNRGLSISLRRLRSLLPGAGLSIWRRIRPAVTTLGLATVASSLNANAPKYFLQHIAGLHALGIFAGISYFQTAATNVSVSMSQALAPRLAILKNAGDKRGFLRVALSAAVLALCLGSAGLTVAFVFGEPVLARMYNLDYANHLAEFKRLMVAAVFFHQVAFLNDALLALRRFRTLLGSVVATGLALVLSCCILIPTRGVRGAAEAVLIGGVFQCCWALYGVSRELMKHWDVPRAVRLSPAA
jgi:O-antigen/teichoic acid export membrane protein